jgi:ABC-type Fe3+/spermidine/putrescine transport system ATPase subunit
MSFLEIQGITKTYPGGLTAVRDVSLRLDEGEILCLLGPSGCGKTTLSRIIAGLEAPDQGVVTFDGRDLTGVRPHEREFGMMFQDFALFPHKSVADNVAFGLRMHHWPAERIRARVAEMLELVDLAALGERAIGRLSGGEQQRVALARALAPGPRLLMLDEPLGSLDRALRERLMLDVRAILKRVGMTAVYVTHDQTEAFAVGDRVAVMNAGGIEQVAAPQDIYDDPATPFVARFLGFRNLLPGRVNDRGEIETAAGRFKPPGTPPAGTPVLLLIKPLQLNPCEPAEPGQPGINQVEGVVDRISFRGRFSQVWLSTGETQLVFEDLTRPAYQAGEIVRYPIMPEQMRIYSTDGRQGR